MASEYWGTSGSTTAGVSGGVGIEAPGESSDEPFEENFLRKLGVGIVRSER